MGVRVGSMTPIFKQEEAMEKKSIERSCSAISDRANEIREEIKRKQKNNKAIETRLEGLLQSSNETRLKDRVFKLLMASGLIIRPIHNPGYAKIDVIAYASHNRTYYIQCKFSINNIGIKEIREVFTGCALYKNGGTPVLITNSRITKQARKMADSLNIEVMDSEDIKSMIDELSGKAAKSWCDQHLKRIILKLDIN